MNGDSFSDFTEPCVFKLTNSADEDAIRDDGLNIFLNDIGADPDDIVSLIIAWQMSAKTFGEFSKDEFVEGLTALKYEISQKFLMM